MKTKLAILLFFSLPAFAALQAGIQWDIRTTGSDTNGGGFDPTVTSPGTDESQANSGTSYTDIVIGSTTTQATSSGNPFSATTHGPGNIMHITGGTGCTAGWFETLSQSSGTATFDRSLGTAASTCSGTLGGSMLTIGKLVSTNPTIAVAGNTINVKAGAYTLTAGVPIDPGMNSVNLTWIGYNSTHADGGTRPLITTATNSLKLLQVNNAPQVFQNINFSNTAGTNADCVLSGSTSAVGVFRDVKISGCAVGVNFDNGVGFAGIVYLYNTEVAGCTGAAALKIYYDAFILDGSYIHDNTGYGLEKVSAGHFNVVANSVIARNAGNIHLNSTDELVVTNSVLAFSTAASIDYGSFAAGSQSLITLDNSVCYGNTTYCVNISAASANTRLPGRNTAWGGNGTADFLNFGYGPGYISLSANPFVDATSSSGHNNWALNGTAGGGAALVKAGWPGVGLIGTGYLDVGAIQTSGGAGGVQVTSAYSN